MESAIAACGKVILFGEHAVVHGRPALALGWPGAVRVASTRPAPTCRVAIPEWGMEAGPDSPGPVGEALALLPGVLPGEGGLQATLRADLPPSAGLGSSASLAIVLVRALARLRGLDPSADEILRAADALERKFHGNPSGIDAAVALQGGLCLFRRGGWDGAPAWTARFADLAGGARRVPFAVPGLLVGDTGERRSTGAQVAAVSALATRDPGRLRAFLDGSDDALRAGLDALEHGDPAALGAALDRAHANLAAVGVTTPALEWLAVLARRAGALGVKLTGGGGGGCVVALAPGREQAVLDAWRDAGFRGFAVAGTPARDAAAKRSRDAVPRPAPAAARAGTNIALVKYWGKRDPALNLPAAGSLSLTLAGMGTRTEVAFDPALDRDEVVLNGRPAAGRERDRVVALLDRVRELAGLRMPASVRSANTVPTAAGLASSASGFAALAVAATRAAGLPADLARVADLARRGSGSAPRSLLGGFVELPAGAAPDGSDALPRTILGPDAWDVRLVVALAGTGPKAVGSTEGMERTRRTSPYYEAWLALCREHLPAAADAVRARDLGALGPIVEASARAMHAAALAADPPVAYWTPVTLALLACVRGLRDRGVPAWATIDAGPHVKVLCAAGDAPAVAGALAAVPRVVRVFEERPGAAAEGMDGCA